MARLSYGFVCASLTRDLKASYDVKKRATYLAGTWQGGKELPSSSTSAPGHLDVVEGVLEFPPCLTPFDRLLVHELCEALGLLDVLSWKVRFRSDTFLTARNLQSISDFSRCSLRTADYWRCASDYCRCS